MDNMNGVLGNSIDIHVGKNDKGAEIRADIKVDEFTSKRIWGQVINCQNQPIKNSLVKLVRVVCQGDRKYYEGVAHTITDCEGFYQFDVCENNENECYKIIINKAVTGQEIVIDTKGGNCGYCDSNGCGNGNGGGAYNPCLPYNPIVKPYNPNECKCGGHCHNDYNNNCNHNHNHNCNHNNNGCNCNEHYRNNYEYNESCYNYNENCHNESCHNENEESCNKLPKTNYATYTR